MSKRLTFGVELEFHIGFLQDYQKEPYPQSKCVRFPPIPDEPSGPVSLINERRIFTHVGQTIAGAQFPINVKVLCSGDTDLWEIEADASLVDYIGADGYWYQGIEVKSPALPFNEASLKEIEAVCKLLTDTYRIENGFDSGLHVHLGHEKHGFEFQNIQRLMIFLYTFDPQINSLHPPHRLEYDYGSNSPRDRSVFSANFQARYGRAPSAREFAAEVYSCRAETETRSRQKLINKTFKDKAGHKDGNYNFMGVQFAYNLSQPGTFRQTIEFRQHEGTLDGTRIRHWIHVIAAIVRFVETDTVNFHRLMQTMWREEKWEKAGDGNDAERAAEMGPILADYGFTIIDLLRYLGKHAQADYFRDKWQKHDIPPRYDEMRSDTTWDFMWDRNNQPEDLKRNTDLAACYQAMRLLNWAESKSGEEQTQIDESTFPKQSVVPILMSDDEKGNDEKEDDEETDQKDTSNLGNDEKLEDYEPSW